MGRKSPAAGWASSLPAAGPPIPCGSPEFGSSSASRCDNVPLESVPVGSRLSEGCLSLAAPASDLQSRRRRGIGRALVAARLADASERGATTVVSALVPTVGGYGKHSNSAACGRPRACFYLPL